MFNYPVHSGVCHLAGAPSRAASLPAPVSACSQRYQRDPYGLWDIYAASNRHRDPAFSATQQRDEHVLRGDLPSVAMPGRSVIGGIEVLYRRD